MLSAITRKLDQLEKETRENTMQLANMKMLLGLDDNVTATNVSDVCQTEGKLKTILLRHEGKLRTTEFKLNRVYDLSARHSREILELKCKLHEAISEEADDFDENGKQVDELGQDFAYNPMAPEFKPRPRELPEPSSSGIRRLVEINASAQNVPTDSLALKGFTFSVADQHSQLPCSTQNGSGESRESIPTETTNYTESSNSELTTAIFRFEDIKEELLFYKNLFFKLEIELKRKEELLQNMAVHIKLQRDVKSTSQQDEAQPESSEPTNG
ncbi:hypothetical protein LSH36_382g03026 [Paralvinella palmiformis]|uniref:Uncharacterized protein n=1 Tax=Paralvinella palmiformis TaxID=53620 RepID=A0AAD9JEK5_9ANNE|nr:hypothetical protein LSH36_382g03026 [Paralvinella palmiformis]